MFFFKLTVNVTLDRNSAERFFKSGQQIEARYM